MKNITDIFENNYFRIPDYQRGYAWTEKQLVEFWDDIEDINEQPHYTGTIFVEKITNIPQNDIWVANNGATFYNVVDGQQRLTTISILLYELLKVEKEEYNQIPINELMRKYIFIKNYSGNCKVYHFSYMDCEQNEYLLENIFDDDQIVVKNHNITAYAKNLDNAKKFFANKIYNLKKSERDILFTKIITRLHFDFNVINNTLDVQAVFETMNNRGKPLTVLEKLKNRLIYLTEKLSNCSEDKQKLRENINNAWGKIYIELAKNPDNILDEDDFLSAHLSLYRNPPEYVFSEKQTEEKVFQMFCRKAEKYNLAAVENEKEPIVDFDKINNYVLDLSEFVDYWVKINNPKDNILLQKIYLLETRKEFKIFICALVKALNEKSIQNDFKILEQIIFRMNIPQAWTGRDIRTFATLARDLYANSNKINEIRDELIQELKKEIDITGIIEQFSNLFTYQRGNIGYHRWAGLKYLLFEYEEYLYGNKFSQDAQKIFINNYKQTAIEHIMPKNTTYWEYEANDFINFFNEEHKYLAKNIIINSLGNLTILKDSKNSSLSNNSWQSKKERYSSGSFNEIQIAQNKLWNKYTIFERGKNILEFLFKEKLDIKENLSEDMFKKALFYSVEYYNTGFNH